MLFPLVASGAAAALGARVVPYSLTEQVSKGTNSSVAGKRWVDGFFLTVVAFHTESM